MFGFNGICWCYYKYLIDQLRVCNKLRYKAYIGDGDTQSYHEVVKSDPYTGLSIKKGECVGHVQKRLRTRLRNLSTKLKGAKLSDDKPLIGKGRLTEKVINLSQNYYLMAIRKSTKTVPEMRTAIGVGLYHCSESSSEETRHLYCPKDKDTWCKWQKDKLAGENKYKAKVSIP